MLLAPSNRVIAALASAVPESVRLVAEVRWSVEETPVSGVIAVMAGAPGALVSTVTASAAVAAPTLPAPSVARAVKLCAPLLGDDSEKDQAPLPLAVTLPMALPPSLMVIADAASAVPEKVSAVAATVVPLATAWAP